MKLHDKVKLYRESKKLSQENVAYKLGLNQSQYSRRESGNILFSVKELESLSKLFEIQTSDLLNDEKIIFNKKDQKRGIFGNYITMPNELIQQYEKRLQEKDEYIATLKEQISLLNEAIKELNKPN